MKAIACPQCGALIKTVSNKEKFAVCEYCAAKIILPLEPESRVETPKEPELTPYQQYQDNYRKTRERAAQYDAPYTYPQKDNDKAVLVPLLLIFLVVGIVVFISANSKSCLSRPLADDDDAKIPFKTANSPKIEYPVSTPEPRINYQVKVQWQGANDMEHFENPQIENSKLPSLDEAELKKTVFKNRAVQVRITIDTNGSVTKVEAISGHPVLKEAAVEAARKTIFNPRQKPTTRVLTYYFHLIEEK